MCKCINLDMDRIMSKSGKVWINTGISQKDNRSSTHKFTLQNKVQILRTIPLCVSFWEKIRSKSGIKLG